MIQILQEILLLIVIFFFLYKRGLIFLQIAQQDEYSPKALLSWHKDNFAFDKRGSLIALFTLLIAYFCECYLAANLIGITLLFILFKLTPNPIIEGKKTLNFTNRSKKIFYAYLLLLSLILITFTLIHGNCHAVFFWIYCFLLFQLPPFLIMLAIYILNKPEKMLQDKFLNEAKVIFRNSGTCCIGVTGSYGKTSVKNHLGEIIQTTLGSCFWPSEGTNTLMGITREIREKLNRFYKYSIIEMAAYRVGSISKSCKLCPPKISIITAIGSQHLERFGSLDVTYKAKTEIAKALPKDGILVCNYDNELSRKAGKEFNDKISKTIFYGLTRDPLNNCYASDIKIDKTGTSFNVHWENEIYPSKTTLLGKHAVSNLLCCFVTACTLGAKPKNIIAAIAGISPVNHRLKLEKRGDYYVLDDAYNANEKGFAYALEVVKEFEASKKIIMTPGVIELGEKQYKINKELAKSAMKICDYFIAVGEPNRQAFSDGFSDKNRFYTATSRDEAFKKLDNLVQKDALVLIANDLTDFHENIYKF